MVLGVRLNREPEFTRDKLVLDLQTYVVAQEIKRIAPSSVKRDIDCLIRGLRARTCVQEPCL